MKKTEVIASAKNSISKAAFKLSKHSPEIFLVVGAIGVVASAIGACVATTKLSKITEEASKTVESIREYEADEAHGEQYTPEDAKKDVAIVYIQTGAKIAALYAPSVVLGALSLTAIFVSNGILRKRAIALAAALTTVDNSFKEYRQRVIAKFGEEVEREIKYNVKKDVVTDIIVDPETGEAKTEEREVHTLEALSPYSRIFDENNYCWEKNSDANHFFLTSEQNYANDRLRARGYLFLNEVYERLGFEPTEAGQIVGWVYDLDNPKGSNFVDFGFNDIHDERKRAFLSGCERNVVLDFNVDGNIMVNHRFAKV